MTKLFVTFVFLALCDQAFCKSGRKKIPNNKKTTPRHLEQKNTTLKKEKPYFASIIQIFQFTVAYTNTGNEA